MSNQCKETGTSRIIFRHKKTCVVACFCCLLYRDNVTDVRPVQQQFEFYCKVLPGLVRKILQLRARTSYVDSTCVAPKASSRYAWEKVGTAAVQTWCLDYCCTAVVVEMQVLSKSCWQDAVAQEISHPWILILSGSFIHIFKKMYDSYKNASSRSREPFLDFEILRLSTFDSHASQTALDLDTPRQK